MIEKGISLYPGMGYSLAASLDYLQLARQSGFNRLFTSLQLREADKETLLTEFRSLASVAVSLGFFITADISSRSFRLLGAGLDNPEPLRELGLSALRLGFGFSAAEIACWSRRSGFYIELNASTIEQPLLDAVLAAGADISRLRACHQYYPRPETGLSWDLFRERSLLLRASGISVAAFIPSRKNPGGPLAAGLPTLESHRCLQPLTAARQLVYSGLVDAVLFGDSLAGSEELQTVGSVRPDCAELRVRVKPHISPGERELLFAAHANRTDPGEWAVRAEASQRLAACRVPPRLPSRRSRGSVTIDNENYLCYMGELQLVRKDLEPDERVNVVAEVVPEDMCLIDMIRPGMKFRFIEA